MDTLFKTLNRDFLMKHVNEFISMCQRNMQDEYWNESHFLTELPGKWHYSFYAVEGSVVKAFIIASEKEQSVHIHKFVVDRPFQREGLGGRMLNQIAELAPKPITLKVRTDNEKAISFYNKEKFVVYSMDKEMQSMIRSISS